MSRKKGHQSVTISGIDLQINPKGDVTVLVEINDQWVPVIKEFWAPDNIVAHIVEPNGIIAAASRGRTH